MYNSLKSPVLDSLYVINIIIIVIVFFVITNITTKFKTYSCQAYKYKLQI